MSVFAMDTACSKPFRVHLLLEPQRQMLSQRAFSRTSCEECRLGAVNCRICGRAVAKDSQNDPEIPARSPPRAAWTRTPLRGRAPPASGQARRAGRRAPSERAAERLTELPRPPAGRPPLQRPADKRCQEETRLLRRVALHRTPVAMGGRSFFG